MSGNRKRTTFNGDRFIDVPAAAEFLSVTEKAVRNMVHKRQIPFYRKGRRIRFLMSDLIEWMEEDRVEPHEIYM